MVGSNLLATLLAMRDWRRGVPSLAYIPIDEDEDHGSPPNTGDDIESTYGLQPFNCNLYERGREIGRLTRVFGAIANIMAEGTFPPVRPYMPRLSEGVVCVPFDLDQLAEELLHGTPQETVALAKLGVDGLSRGWVMSLYQAVERAKVAPDLPLLERLRIISEEGDGFDHALPTHRLAERVKEGLTKNGRQPLGEALPRDWSLADRFYKHPLVIAANLEQGKDRYTAFKIMHRMAYTVLKRNEPKFVPVSISTPEDIAEWRKRGAVEFWGEIGKPVGDEYHVDRLFVDLDPRNGFPLDDLKVVALEAYRRVSEHEWVDPEQVYLHWTGGKGFHIIGHFRHGLFVRWRW